MKTSHKIGITAAAGIIGLGSLVGVALANAEDPTDTSTPSASSTQAPPQDRPGGKGGQHGAEMAAALAEKLGMDQATVQTAIDAAHEATRPAEPTEGTPPDREAMQAAFITELANQLGVDEGTLTTAVEEIRAAAEADRKAEFQTRLDEAVAAGTISQEDADAVMRAAEAGVIGYGGGGRGR